MSKLPAMYDMSIVKKSNSWTMDEAHKKELDTSRLKHNEVNLRSYLKVLQITQVFFMNIFRCLDDHQKVAL